MPTEFAVEPYADIIEDLKPTLQTNFDELATYKDIPLDPNYAFYEKAAELGMVRFYSARQDGWLVGYCVMTVPPRHAHYNHPWATSNLFWIHPDFRRSGVARGLLSFIKQNLVGYVVQIATSVDHPALAVLLESEGFAMVETVHSIRL